MFQFNLCEHQKCKLAYSVISSQNTKMLQPVLALLPGEGMEAGSLAALGSTNEKNRPGSAFDTSPNSTKFKQSQKMHHAANHQLCIPLTFEQL